MALNRARDSNVAVQVKRKRQLADNQYGTGKPDRKYEKVSNEKCIALTEKCKLNISLKLWRVLLNERERRLRKKTSIQTTTTLVAVLNVGICHKLRRRNETPRSLNSSRFHTSKIKWKTFRALPFSFHNAKANKKAKMNRRKKNEMRIHNGYDNYRNTCSLNMFSKLIQMITEMNYIFFIYSTRREMKREYSEHKDCCTECEAAEVNRVHSRTKLKFQAE